MFYRREFLRALLSAPAGLLLGRAGRAQASPIRAARLSDRLLELEGDGGNIAVLIAEDGVLLVDSGLPDRAADLIAAVKQNAGSGAIRMLLNTHWHFDHVGANETLGKAGAGIMAHENVKRRLSERVNMEAVKRVVEPLKPEGRPSMTFTSGGKLTFGRQTVEYAPVPPAHTDGDTCYFFPAANVLHAGDLFFNGSYPFIDASTGGWIGGMAAAAGILLKTGDEKTRIIPGHGPLASKADLRVYRDMLATLHQRMAALAKQGKSVEEAIAAAPAKEFEAKLGDSANFVRIAYSGLLARNSGAR